MELDPWKKNLTEYHIAQNQIIEFSSDRFLASYLDSHIQFGIIKNNSKLART